PDSLNTFTRVLTSSRESSVGQAFGFSEDEPLEQVIRLYLKQSQPRAALKLAEQVTALQTKESEAKSESKEETVQAEESSTEAKKYQTLRTRAIVRQRNARVELLELLSVAAEQIEDLRRATELEEARLRLLMTVADKRTAKLRLERLHEMQRTIARQPKPSLVIDQRLVSL
ncbi:MAG TPA: hypothetical protein VIF64_19155, partial [Pyrinomonadaceae bacterium]